MKKLENLIESLAQIAEVRRVYLISDQRSPHPTENNGFELAISIGDAPASSKKKILDVVHSSGVVMGAKPQWLEDSSSANRTALLKTGKLLYQRSEQSPTSPT